MARRKKSRGRKSKYSGMTIGQLKAKRSNVGSKTKMYAKLSGAIARKRR